MVTQEQINQIAQQQAQVSSAQAEAVQARESAMSQSSLRQGQGIEALRQKQAREQQIADYEAQLSAAEGQLKVQKQDAEEAYKVEQEALSKQQIYDEAVKYLDSSHSSTG